MLRFGVFQFQGDEERKEKYAWEALRLAAETFLRRRYNELMVRKTRWHWQMRPWPRCNGGYGASAATVGTVAATQAGTAGVTGNSLSLSYFSPYALATAGF